jgi:hypothetical protein
VPCLLLEARNTTECNCDPNKARLKVSDLHQAAVRKANESPIAPKGGWSCFCEVTQAGDPLHSSPEELTACQDDAGEVPLVKGGPKDGQPADGWCYVDATTTPPTGDPEIVKDCADTEKHLVRFVGAGNPLPNATLFITCSGE